MQSSSDRPIITLLSDFGSLYPAEMKGAILSLARDAILVDIAHDIPPQDFRAGAFVLMAAARHFPEGTIHLAVVDPGVGTDRRGLVVESGGHLFVGPDNGLLIPAARSLGEPATWMIDPSFTEGAAPTFAGRDVFAPAASMLALGARPESFGPRVEPVTLDFGGVRRSGDGIVAEVIYVDGFGNLVLNAREISWDRVVVSGVVLRRVRTYAEVGVDEPLITIGSHEFAEIAVNGGSARDLFGLSPGDRVLLERGNCSE
ncbi:MAG TPA: SAM-dependent chlorinase/fluorinase [Methanothrix sp.]|nr:SAM-dependent chlorinase/fluorinase [Methanothrix sp.]HPJ84481.1 SAM-dependent chlorinase/fluorinase [Methanothrix sp.]HPR66450.1 SAM-dependent chlorinase/fluorinase [Methanothrix sp.]